jgi:hypothetical protein
MKKVEKNEAIQATISQPNTTIEINKSNKNSNETVLVPNWRIIHFKELYKLEGTEVKLFIN